MRDIEEKEKGRDWQGAKKALHQYFINTGRKYHNPSGRHTISADELALQMENIYSVIPPIGFGVVPVQTEDFSVNVTDTVRKMWEIQVFISLLCLWEGTRMKRLYYAAEEERFHPY